MSAMAPPSLPSLAPMLLPGLPCVALEVLLGQDVPDWGAHLQAAPEDQLRVQKALEVFGDVRDRDYYTFTMRFEAIEQAYLGLLNNPAGMAPQP